MRCPYLVSKPSHLFITINFMDVFNCDRLTFIIKGYARPQSSLQAGQYQRLQFLLESSWRGPDSFLGYNGMGLFRHLATVSNRFIRCRTEYIDNNRVGFCLHLRTKASRFAGAQYESPLSGRLSSAISTIKQVPITMIV